jgi:hypothetical protein
VITIIIVALLTGGYSLTALLWFACPSILFRQEYIFIPATACSIFGFLGTAWALISSPRYNVNTVSCPVTIALTLLSATVYGGLAIHTQRSIDQVTRRPSWPSHLSNWHDSGYYTPYASSTAPLAAQSINSDRASGTYNVVPPTLTEEELVNQQMATLLTKGDPRPSPDATQATFRLEWPPGGEEEDVTMGPRRVGTLQAMGRYLAPTLPTNHNRNRNEGVMGAFSKIGRAIGLGDRSRDPARDEALAVERARSREERRREIELGHL